MMDREQMEKELQRLIDAQVAEMNATPREEMDGLAPNEMFHLIHDPFGKASILGFQESIHDDLPVTEMPFFDLFEKYLQIIDETGAIPLTQKGNLKVKLVKELYEISTLKEQEIEKGISKLNKEQDSVIIQNLRIMGLLSGITKKRKNKISLTEKGKALMKEPGELFKAVFVTHLRKFNIGFHDRYPQEASVQQLIGFTFYLLLMYGDKKRRLSFYADKNLRAFPSLPEEFMDSWGIPQKQYVNCYWLRVFKRLLLLYGFVETDEADSLIFDYSTSCLWTTNAFHEVFRLKDR